MKKIIALIALAAALLAGVPVGQPFPATTLEDPFGASHTVNTADGMILISFERAVSEEVNAFLKAQPKGFLRAHNATYIADISAMPKIISKLFALPKMRDYNYTLLLNYDEAFKKRLDRKEGKLTLYRLKDGNVVALEFIGADRLAEQFAD